MKNRLFASLLLLCAIFVWPGASCRIGRDGVSINPVTPPADAIVGVSVSSIGIDISENPATQMPHAVIGWKRISYNRIAPVARNKFVPAVRSKIGLKQNGFNAGIDEIFETEEKVSGKVCEIDAEDMKSQKQDPPAEPKLYFPFSALRMSPLVSYAGLNRRFDRGSLAPRHRAYLWTLEQIRLIRPELRGTDRQSTFLSVRGLRNEGYSGDATSLEWCVLNRAGWPVKPRPEFLRTEVNLVSADAPEWQLRTINGDGFVSTVVWSLSGAWNIEARTVGFGFVWQFVRRVAQGETVKVNLETDPAWGEKELRVVPAL